MTPRNIRQTDLNLLIALNVLMEERNVTRAADRLDLTQSAASRMLGRLRLHRPRAIPQRLREGRAGDRSERDGSNAEADQGQRIQRVGAASSVEDDTFMVHSRAGGSGAES